MLFNSWSFLAFFPIVVGGHWLLPAQARWAWLLAASCVFYAAFVPAYLLILFAVIGIDYAAGLLIAGSAGTARRRWLGLSVVANLALLGTFKYFDFFAANARALGELIGWNLPIPILQLLLPIGLSFHVFQSLSYTIEVYRGNQAAERHLGIYALYVMFWPQLVAGPIERPQNLLPQFHALPGFDRALATSGLRRMLWGFFKKCVVADRLALLVDPVFTTPAAYPGPVLALAALAFTFQIYCDFSGYSDIAVGSARAMGVRLMDNFRHPYAAHSVQDFWSRWHISLSTWFRDYVYIPLGGSRVGQARWSTNLMIVFLVSGLWHGANWTYVAWGALHGGLMVVSIWTAGLREGLAAIARWDRWPAPVRTAWQLGLTFTLVTFAWIFFRAASLTQAAALLASLPLGWEPGLVAQALAGLPRISRTDLVLDALFVATLLGVEAWQRRGGGAALDRWPRGLRLAAYQAVAVVLLLFGVYDSHAFIYFQF